MHEFLLEVRFRWENSQTLPGLPSGVPDQGYSLFHQKLQMINCCIERKIARDTAKDCQTQQSLGMISHKESLITIFGHKHEIKNFIEKFDIFH